MAAAIDRVFLFMGDAPDGRFGAHLSSFCCVATCVAALQQRARGLAICLMRPRLWPNHRGLRVYERRSAAEHVSPAVEDVGLPDHGSVLTRPAGTPEIVSLLSGPGDDRIG